MSPAPALLLTDVVDSTQLNDRLGDAVMAPLWAAHDRAARDLMREHGGTEVGRSDGFLVLFPTATAAVGFALAYHRGLAALSPPLSARVGIHVGPVELRRNSAEDTARGATPFEVDGVALPTAARVMAAAGGGQTLLSASAFAALDAPKSWRVQSHGHWRLKGLTEPIELLEIGDDGQAPFVPPADSTKAYRVLADGGLWRPLRELPHNLPAEPDAFVGRREALQALAHRFDDDGARLVTVLGIGGIGKTRLALRYARSWLGDFPGGAWFCDLSAARSADGVLHAVAQALDVPLGKADPVRQLGAAIAGRGRCLVILDNFEQVAAHAQATLGSWLTGTHDAAFLVTSRELLGLPGERTLALEPLARTEACDMFSQRMAAADMAAPASAADDDAIASLVELIDRLPLAIELAAARARVIPPREQLQRMGDRFKLLASRSGRLDRQATMRAALDWGWELLPMAEQSALAQLSVFEGGFTLDTAEAVVRTPDGSWVPDLLQALVEKSWLRRSEHGRLDLLATVRHYGSERLLQMGDTAAQAQRRHWQHHAGFDDARATADRCIEVDNLVLGCQRASAAGDADAAVGCLIGAWAALRLTGPLGAAVGLAQACLSLPGMSAPRRADAAWVAGSALYLLGKIDAARSQLLEARAGALPGGVRDAAAACALGELESTAGDPALALAPLNEALAHATRLADAALQCRALNALGALAGDSGRTDEAQGLYARGLAVARAHQQVRWEGVLLGNLGTLQHMQGRHGPAAEHYEAAIEIAHRVGDRRGEGDRRSNLGLLHLEQGRLVPAQAELQRALAIARATGHVRLQAVVLCNLGLAWEAADDWLQAAAAFEEAVVTAHELGDRRGESLYRVYLGRVLVRQGRTNEARDCLQRAATALEGSDDASTLGLLHCAEAEAALASGTADEARPHLARAEAQRQRLSADSAAELAREIARIEGQRAAALSPG